MNDIIDHYLRAALGTTEDTALDPGLITYLAGLEQVRRVAPDIARHIVQELADQRANLKLIASENYSSLASQAAMGNLLTDKYAEGVPGHRFYAGCDNVDAIEQRAAELACSLFGADHAYVQPHSGADANLVAFWAILSARVEQPALQRMEARSVNDLDASDWAELRTALGNQRLLGMDLGAGGHLTHGYRPNVSGRMFEAHSYGVDAASGRIDYDALAAQAEQVRPLVLLAGYSAYPRALDFRRLRAIADSVDAVLMVDMAHFAGLVAGGVLRADQNPIPFADIITSTTHKTLRGPRGGMVLCRAELADAVDRGCPLVLGGPLPHVLAAKAVAFGEASAPQFAAYAEQVVANAQALAAACQQEGLQVVTGGTDNHLMLLDLTAAGITGRQAESALRACAITCNRNALPGDVNGPWYTSGLRLGTPALTTLGMQPQHMAQVAQLIRRVLAATEPELVAGGRNAGKPSKANFRLDADVAAAIVAEVRTLLAAFPVYPQLDLPLLQRLVGPAPAVEQTAGSGSRTSTGTGRKP